MHRSPPNTPTSTQLKSASLAVAVVVLLVGACGAPDPERTAAGAPRREAVAVDPASVDPAITSHERMAALLVEVRNGSDASNHWQGEGPAVAARARLESLAASAPPLERWEAVMRVAEHELRLGDAPRAIERFEEALALLRGLGGEAPQQAVAKTLFRLGVANLRWGELTNCAHAGAEACILPLRGAAIHRDPVGSRRAIAWFEQVLRLVPPSAPSHLKTVWLLNLASRTLDAAGELPAELRLPSELFEGDGSESSFPGLAFPRLANVAGARGVDTFNLSGGAAIDDFDGDGHVDLLTTTSDLAFGPRFFHGDGAGNFEDRTERTGIGDFFGGLNLVPADYDNDGDLDVYVLRGAWLYANGRHPSSLWRNEGDGRFVDVTFLAGLGDQNYPTQTAAWADYDNDGNVDLFVGNEHGDGRSQVGLSGEEAVLFDAPCRLFRNLGDGTFVDVAEQAGVAVLAFVKGVAWGDIDNDGLQDLYLSILGAPNRLFRNRGDGAFEDVTARAGVAEPTNSFPVWFFDFDNDGALDLFVPSYRGAEDGVALYVASALGLDVPWDMPRLYRGDGRGGFRDVAAAVGLDRLVLPMGANFGDLDSDGWLDIYLGTGYPDYEALMPNVLYRNVEGRRFEDVTLAAGVGHLQKGHAVSFADVDEDGDLDLFAQMGGAFPGDRFHDALFENPGTGRHWLIVEVEGRASNRSGIGARVRVVVRSGSAVRALHRAVNSGGSFGANPLRQFFGLGAAAPGEQIEVERVELDWPSGARQVFEQPPIDAHVRAVEGAESLEIVSVLDA